MFDQASRVETYEHNAKFEKTKTWFLYYEKEIGPWSSAEYTHHTVRGSESSYDDIVFQKPGTIITVGAAYLSFRYDLTLSEILVECAVRGINIDFIEVCGTDPKTNNSICLEFIDCHKGENKNVETLMRKVEFPRHYVAKNMRKSDVLKFLVVDRYAQRASVDYFHGRYEKSGIRSGFISYEDAADCCLNLNKMSNDNSATPGKIKIV